MTTILVIEDMESLREEILETLSFEGFIVLGAENGAIGVQMAKENLPNLVICDVMMPELDGYGALKALRQDTTTVGIPFIFLTAKADKSNIRQGMDLGADDYLTKPFTTDELLGAIAARLKKQSAVKEHYDLEIRRAEEQLNYFAYYDQLTKLPNRVSFHNRFKEVIEYAQQENESVALLFLDIDHFNVINNSLGHDIGDLLFKAIAERLRLHIPPCDMVARLRGDEFAIILQNVVEEDVKQTAQKILNVIAQPFKLYGHEIFITASIGITLYPTHHVNVESLIKNADMAMYHAKREGRNIFKYYNPALDQKSSEQMALENSLRRAIERQEFRLYYQPQLDLQTGKIVGAEALVRWQHRELGIVMPSKFVPLAEETGLIIGLGEWVIHTVCQQHKVWQEKGLPQLRIAINISGQHFKRGDLITTIKDAVKTAGISYSNLEMELTESIIMQNASTTVAMLAELKSLGTNIAIDDFGTGYSSLSYLKHFPVSTIKIDRCFVEEITTDKHDAAISLAIIELSHSLGLKVIAEGVETQAQFDFLKESGCDQMQGYLFSPPVPPEEFERLFLQNTQQG